MRPELLCFLTTLAAVWPQEARGQASRTDTLYLRIVERATRRPLLRAWLNHWGGGQTGNARYLGQSRGDTTGAVHGLVQTSGSSVEVVCARADGYDGGRIVATLDSTKIAQLDIGDTTTISVDATGCDQRDLAEKAGSWLGYYSSGFELSEFQWCGDTTRRIWVEYGKGAQARSPILWPDHPDDIIPQYFVGFRGRLLGPFSYGHFGTSQYQLTVDSILFARRPSGSDCRT
jgi:hypothetical protein